MKFSQWACLMALMPMARTRLAAKGVLLDYGTSGCANIRFCSHENEQQARTAQ